MRIVNMTPNERRGLIEEISILDHLSHGRLDIGVGRGVSPFELNYQNEINSKKKIKIKAPDLKFEIINKFFKKKWRLK